MGFCCGPLGRISRSQSHCLPCHSLTTGLWASWSLCLASVLSGTTNFSSYFSSPEGEFHDASLPLLSVRWPCLVVESLEILEGRKKPSWLQFAYSDDSGREFLLPSTVGPVVKLLPAPPHPPPMAGSDFVLCVFLSTALFTPFHCGEALCSCVS